MRFRVGDPVVAPKHQSRKGSVVEVNEKWKWVKVRFRDGKVKTYEITAKYNSSIHLDPEEVSVCLVKYCGHGDCLPS
jgi:hypothetical protein